MNILYVGTRAGMDHFMFGRDINPSEHGRSVLWAANGPQHLKADGAPFEIIEDEDWYDKTIFDQLSIDRARLLNGVERSSRRRKPHA